MKRISLFLFCGALIASVALADDTFDQRLDRFCTETLAAYRVVPGFAIAVVRGDQVLFAQGYGLRDVESRLPVTAETGFYLASSTKSFTGLAAAILARRHALDLDAPVTRYLPELELPAPLDPAAITLRDLLTHRTGIANSEVQRHLAFEGPLTREQFVAMMREKSRPMAREFAYSNLGYNMLGYVLESATGKSWQQLVAEEVLGPLGMKRTTTLMTEGAAGELAYPYVLHGSSFERLELKSDGRMHAAGGIVSTANDLAIWLRANLESGRLGERQVLDPAAVADAHRKWAETDREYFRFHRTGYGFGWYWSEFEGELLLHHFGGYDGYHAHVSFMPERGIGVAALVNTNEYGAGTMTHLVAAYAYDLLLDRPDAAARWQRERDQLVARTLAEKEFEEAVTEALNLFAAGDEERATSALGGALERGAEAGVVDERTVNRLGYSLLGDGKLDPAIEVFRFNARSYPDSANVHDSLGEAYEKVGDLKRARESYARATQQATADKDPNGVALFRANLDRVEKLLREEATAAEERRLE